MGLSVEGRKPGGFKGPPKKRKGPEGPFSGPRKGLQVQHKIHRKDPGESSSGGPPRGPPEGGPRDPSKGKQGRRYRPKKKEDGKQQPQRRNSSKSSSNCNNGSNSSSSGGKLLPQWAVAAIKAGEAAKAKAAATAAARASLPSVPHLSLAHVADATQQQQPQEQQQEQQKGKKVPGQRGLSGISGIESLDMHGRGVHTAEDLSALKHLRRIDVSENHLKSLAFLSLNLSLGSLKAAKNQIAALGNALENLSSLRVVDLSDNQVAKHTHTRLAGGP